MRATSLAIALTVLIPSASRGDVIQHFVGGTAPGQFPDVSGLLDTVGIGSGNVASESTASSFFVPGIGSTDLTFTFQRDTGGFFFEFGFFNANAVSGIDPVANPQMFAEAAIGAAVSVFDDRMVDPGAMTTLSVDGGTELGFFIVPDNTIQDFLDDPDAFFAPGQDFRSPLFSLADANPGQFDQFLAFAGNGVTLFTFEDLTRAGASDQDFTDLAFTIDAQLSPERQVVPEPGTMVIAGLAMVGGLFGAARRRSRAKSA